MLLMIDNYDSFTFNLVQYFCELGEEVKVYRNDEITLDEIAALKPDRLVLSPGPCSPAEAGICVPALQRFTGQLPILGVCLGHQSIGAALGGKVVRAHEQMHGKTSYHSLAIERESLPSCLEITSTTPDGEIMGVRHTGPQHDPNFAPLEGVQFHPESILTEHGHAMLANFLKM